MESTITKVLKLTQHGEARLAAYPKEAIAYAESIIKKQSKTKQIKDVFIYFEGICKEYCKQYQLTVDRNRSYIIIQQVGIDISTPFVEENKVFFTTTTTEEHGNQKSFEQQEDHWAQNLEAAKKRIRETNKKRDIQLMINNPDKYNQQKAFQKELLAIIGLDEQGQPVDTEITDQDRMVKFAEALSEPEKIYKKIDNVLKDGDVYIPKGLPGNSPPL